MTSPTLFRIWQDTLQKVKFLSIDNFTTNKFILLSTCYPHFLVSWRRQSKKTEKITLQSQINFTQTMLPQKIPQPWKQSLVRRYLLYNLGFDWIGSQPFVIPQEIRAWVYFPRTVRIPWFVRFLELGLEIAFPLPSRKSNKNSSQHH